MKLSILTYNVNGIRAAIKKGLIDFLSGDNSDIVCFQELKASADQIPDLLFQELGYQTYWHSAEKKGYSGTGLLTKIKPDKVEIGMGIPKYDAEGRMIKAYYGSIVLINVYHPSGSSGDERQAFKMQWLDDFDNYIQDFRKQHPDLIICGDFNICHTAIDIHDPIGNANNSGFLPEERAWIDQFINKDFIDAFRYFHPNEPGHYTWWSYRAKNARERNIGWRIDYFMVSKSLKDKMISCEILPKINHSDHCPVKLSIDL
ncbi:MAG: exodeoxyribonuclease III [Bacteroidales bacterium]